MICNIGQYDIDMTQVAAVGPSEARIHGVLNEEQSVYAVYLKGGDRIVIEESDKPREEFVRMWKNPEHRTIVAAEVDRLNIAQSELIDTGFRPTSSIAVAPETEYSTILFVQSFIKYE